VFQADRLPLEVKGRREEAIVRCKEEEEEEEHHHHHHHHHHDSMPTFNVQTNVPLDDCVLVSDILKQTSKAVANIIGKPESYVMISLRGGVPMLFGGSEDPTAYGELISIGGLGPEINEQLSAALAEILQMKLSVPPARFYIKFYDVKGHSCTQDKLCMHVLHH
jgi:phenylpyruvate tautomerase